MSAIASVTTRTAAAAAVARSTAAPSSASKASVSSVLPQSRRRGASVVAGAALRGAPDATLNESNTLTSDDVSSWEEIDTQIANMCAKYAGDSSVNGRIMALTDLGPDKTYEALDDITVVDVYQAAWIFLFSHAAQSIIFFFSFFSPLPTHPLPRACVLRERKRARERESPSFDFSLDVLLL